STTSTPSSAKWVTKAAWPCCATSATNSASSWMRSSGPVGDFCFEAKETAAREAEVLWRFYSLKILGPQRRRVSEVRQAIKLSCAEFGVDGRGAGITGVALQRPDGRELVSPSRRSCSLILAGRRELASSSGSSGAGISWLNSRA